MSAASGPYAIELVAPAGLTLSLQPGLPARFDVESSQDLHFDTTITAATTAELTGSLAVTLSLDGGIVLPVGLSLGDFVAHASDDSGEVAAHAFSQVSGTGSYQVMFDDLLADQGSYRVDLSAPAGILFEIGQPRPAQVSLEAGTITYLDLGLTAVTAGSGGNSP